jgi:hypothetical protein
VATFKGRKGDLKWGVYDYPVTYAQKQALDGLWYLLSGLPRVSGPQDGVWALPEGGFYSQRPNDGTVIIGLHNRSVSVTRRGLIRSNQ